MKIEIETPYNMWADNTVAVVVDGFCNHGGDLEDDQDNPIDPDQRSEAILVCRRCGAWKYANAMYPNDWHNEIILEEKI